MEGRHDIDKLDDAMLPGFRFHPTDEELVGFYLRRKIQKTSLPIELIKQVDIYKYDPWDLPKLANSGEKECYFYCRRDRKYRNNSRPNRVTRAGFWKATGTDRPIYSSEGSKCIGLKKSLVFYRGKAAKGIKTDWMMHEFRLPSPPHQSTHDAWAICRIFKKTNSMAHRALSQTWISSLPEPTPSHHSLHDPQFGPNIDSAFQFCFNSNNINTLQLHDIPSYKPQNLTPAPYPVPTGNHLPFMLASVETKNSNEFMNQQQESDNISFKGSEEQFSEFSIGEQQEDGFRMNSNSPQDENQWGNITSIFTLPWDFTDPWDSQPCAGEMFTTNPAYKCYT